ncbi:MAG: TolC family protein [Bacteroidales bacterium]|nr:TolC family protein [Bacteroidales bacterium]
MKTRLIIVLCFAFGVIASVEAQEPDTLMKLVLEQNRELKVAREAYQVAILEAGTGNTPPDPAVEFAYLFGKPSEIGHRIDFGITQQLDFPTTYIHRSKLKKIRNSRAELEYLLTRQEVLLEARQLWIEQIHLNQLQNLLSERVSRARTIRAHVKHMLEAGEVGLLEFNQAHLLVASLEGEFEEVVSHLENNRMAMLEITGGSNIEIHDTLLPLPVEIIPDSVVEAYRLGPYAQLHHQSLQLKEEEKNLAVSNHLPKLSAGYFSETVTNVAFRGFRLGVTVPLWENANTVNKAKSEVAHAEAEVDRYTYQQEKEIRQQLNKLETLQLRVHKLEEALGSANSMALLASAMENGEISLSEYFYTSDFYFRNQQQLLRYKKELLIQEAELLKVYL